MATNTVKVELIGQDKSMGRTLKSTSRSVDALATKMQSFGRSMTIGVTLPIVAGFTLATKAAIDEQKEMALLEQALKKNAKATDAQVASAEKWVTATQNWSGIADGELRPALAAIARSTKDTEEAQKLLGIAMDISVAKGKPLQTVADAIAKAYVGNTSALGRLGIKMKDAEGKTLSFDGVMKNAVETFGGAASEAADTTAGKLAILKAKLADAAEEVGTALIPMVEKGAEWLSKMAEAFNQLSPGMKDFAVKAGLVAAAVGPASWLAGGGIKVVLRLKEAYKAVAKWAGLAAAAQSGVGGVGKGVGGKAAGGAAGALAGAAAGAVVAVSVVAVAAGVGYLLGKAIQNAQATKGGKRPGNTFGWSDKAKAQFDTKQPMAALDKWERRYARLREKLTERLAMGDLDNENLLKRIDQAQEKVDLFRKITRLPFAVGHLKNANWLNPIEKATQKRNYFKSLVQDPITSGHLDTSPITNAIAHATTAYTLMKSYIENTPISSHMTVYKSVASGHEVKPHGGGTFSGPHSGYPAIMHGDETVVSHDHPEKGMRDLAKLGFLSGSGGDTYILNNPIFAESADVAIAKMAKRGSVRITRQRNRTLGYAT